MIGFDMFVRCGGVAGVLGKVTEDGKVDGEDICGVEVCAGVGAGKAMF